MRYALSNRQAKALANGKRLRIALPEPAGDHDPRRFAESVLDVDPAYIRAAWPDVVSCTDSAAATGDVERQVGRMLRGDAPLPPDTIVYRVCVVMLELSDRAARRGAVGVIHDSRLLERTEWRS